MKAASIEMRECSAGESADGRVNCFALVSYIPGPLGHFLDTLRRELEPQTLAPRAHVTLLPPRPLAAEVTPSAAEGHIDRMLGDSPAIDVYLGSIEIFPVTNVVYVSVDGGFLQLRKLHERLNSGPLSFAEPFHYHPHITLVQGLGADEADRVRSEASRRWEQFGGSRRFATEIFTFVQANTAKRWADLCEVALAPAVR